ncbi:MAG: alpha-hydroxy-acid oxidizing protein [Rubrivivax sp.]|nr:alpha-hydroxy-acid oxidizing protein [Rubrivivax sp.]
MTRALRSIYALDDLEPAARRHLPRPVFAYVSGAAEDRVTLRENRVAFDELGFVPRNGIDVSKRHTEVELFGQRWAAPFGIAPMGISALSAYRGDLVQARAAAAARIPMILSGSSLIRMEEVAAASPGLWFQAYLPGERTRNEALIDRVERAGFETLVLTLDASIMPNRENYLRGGFSSPLRPGPRLAWDGLTRPRWLLGTALRTLLRHGMPHFENNHAERGPPIVSSNVVRDFGSRDHLSWADVADVRRRWRGRLVIKGIVSPLDARAARDVGADALIVSNHGGRQLDGTVSPLRMLPAVVDAVGTLPVLIDSGFRRGTHVLKALALGARLVFVGRPFNYAAAVAGQAGVTHAIALLAAEVHRDLGMLGLNSLAELGPHTLRRIAGARDPNDPV